MDTSQVLLQQAADALQETDDARKEAIRLYQVTEYSTIHQSLQKTLLEADLALDRQLSISIPISSLYAAQFHEESHRFHRVWYLIKICYEQAYVFIETAVVLDRETQVRNPVAATKRLLRAIKALELAQHGLDGIFVLESASATAIGDHKCLNTEDYLRPHYPYEDQRKAVLLRDYLTHSEMKSVGRSKITRPIQRILMIEKALYPGHDKTKCYDQVNAVWHSLLASGLPLPMRNAETYMAIYSAMTNHEKYPTHKVLQPKYRAYSHPVAISKGLRSLGFAFGLIFSDDPSHIVWPLGQAISENEYSLVVYCHNRGDTRFLYEGIKFLEIGQKPVRPPRAQRAFPDNQLSWRRYDSRPGPFASGFLSSVLAIANQSSPKWRPFPFLRLPPELRNKVYVEYLSRDDWAFQENWSVRSVSYFKVPELCKASHQLLSEVLPIYLDMKPLQLDGPGFHRIVPLGAQPLLRPMLRFKDIDIRLQGGASCLILLRQKTVGTGFTVEYCRWWSGATSPHKQAMPHILLRPRHFEELVDMLAEDATAEGLGVEELAAVFHFLFVEKDRKLQILRRTGRRGNVWDVELDET